MSLLKKRRPTPAQLAANRANGRKSTGPKTPVGKKIVSLNGLKHGLRAQPAARPLWQTMAVLGEDPARFQALLQGVVRSYPPANPLELRLCEDITRLLLKAERNQRAQEAKLVRTYQRLEGGRRKQRRDMETSFDAVQAEVLETGLRRAPDSPGKFSETMACLERLRKQVEARDFSDETELEALYGKNPTFRGAGIINSFRELAENSYDRDLVASLRLMILEETRDVAEDYQHYYQEHIEISRAMRLECLAPAADREYIELQRQEAAIHQQLERKIKLLVSVQAAARRQAAEPEAADVPGEPIEWFEAAILPPDNADPAPSGKLVIRATQARAIALRHKIGTPRRSNRSEDASAEEVLTRIREIYGLGSEPSAGQPPAAMSSSPTASESLPEAGKQEGAGAQGKPSTTPPAAPLLSETKGQPVPDAPSEAQESLG